MFPHMCAEQFVDSVVGRRELIWLSRALLGVIPALVGGALQT